MTGSILAHLLWGREASCGSGESFQPSISVYLSWYVSKENVEKQLCLCDVLQNLHFSPGFVMSNFSRTALVLFAVLLWQLLC